MGRLRRRLCRLKLLADLVDRIAIAQGPGQRRQHRRLVQQIAVGVRVDIVQFGRLDLQPQLHPFVVRQFEHERGIAFAFLALLLDIAQEFAGQLRKQWRAATVLDKKLAHQAGPVLFAVKRLENRIPPGHEVEDVLEKQIAVDLHPPIFDIVGRRHPFGVADMPGERFLDDQQTLRRVVVRCCFAHQGWGSIWMCGGAESP